MCQVFSKMKIGKDFYKTLMEAVPEEKGLLKKIENRTSLQYSPEVQNKKFSSLRLARTNSGSYAPAF